MKQSSHSHARGQQRDRPPSKNVVRARTRAIWKRAVGGALTAAFIILVQPRLEHTDMGEQLKSATYSWLQHRLRSDSDTIPPIVVVDISAIRPESIRGAQNGEEATPRDTLFQLLSNLAMHHPLAIGVDIDFSPDIDGRLPITPEDSKFFAKCRKLQNDSGVPIYLGVERTLWLPPAQWLPGYPDLAAGILAPRDHLEKMVKCVERNGDTCTENSLAARLAQRITESGFKRPAVPASWCSWLLDCTRNHELTNRLYAGLFAADYSQLRTLKSETRTAAHVLLDDGEFVRDKVVLLGDAGIVRAADTFVVPGETEPIPGVYVHASAAYTLATAPLYMFHRPWLIDAVLALTLIVALSAVQWAYRRSPHEMREDRIESLLIALFVGAVVAFAARVHSHRIMWPDFTMASFGLLMHPRVAHWAGAFLAWLRDRIPVVRGYFFAKEG